MYITVVAFASVAAVSFLLWLNVRGPQPLSRPAVHARAAAKYVLAVFVATFGSAAVAVLLSSPLLIFSRLMHSSAALNLFSRLVDRPYFPLETVVALALGCLTAKSFEEAKPALVWVFPLANALIGVAVLFHKASVLQGHWDWIRETLFNWTDHSASLLQWNLVLPLITSLGFTLGALLVLIVRNEPGAPRSRPSVGR